VQEARARRERGPHGQREDRSLDELDVPLAGVVAGGRRLGLSVVGVFVFVFVFVVGG
jgi:hypothetical protein